MRTLLALVVTLFALVLSSFAIAADGPAMMGGTTHTVGISGLTYQPNDLTIQVGDSVAFSASGTHPLRSDDGLFSCDANCTQTFNVPGEFRYYCNNHGGVGGQGMSGIVRVVGGTTHPVGISGFTYTPATLTIAPGDAVAFAASSLHPLRSDDSLFSCDTDCTVAFPDVGEFRYYCNNHGGAGGQGMSGIIIVQAATSPVIDVDQGSLAGTADAGASTSTAFTIANLGDATLDWSADTATGSCTAPGSVPWIVLDTPAGSIDAGAPATSVGVTLDAGALTPGVYSANICLHSNDTANDPLTLPVDFTVNTPDLIFADGFDG